ncbi:MAG: HNH endonuclease [Colwellia sp.]|nr:HNH endonuclease [Colwellia sp.]
MSNRDIEEFFKPGTSKTIGEYNVWKRNKTKPKGKRKTDNYKKRRDLVLNHFNLNKYATNVGVCLCIHLETEWPIPVKASLYPRYIAKFSRHLNRLANVPARKQHKHIKDFYNSHQWKELRYTALRMSEGKCNLCGATTHDGVSLHVDHIKPRSLSPELQLDLDNLQVMCSDCNIGKKNYDDYDFRNKF